VPLFAPPENLTGTPVRYVLPAGSVVWRVHHEDTPADQFDKPITRAIGGGRFDGTVTTGYSYLYASGDPATAVAERFLPAFDNTPAEDRILLHRRVAGHRLSALRTHEDITLLRLTSAPDLAAVHQDNWLTTAGSRDYPATREWAGWLREMVSWAQGFIWTSTMDIPRTTIVLFEDRFVGPTVLEDHSLGRRLDSRAGISPWLAEMLASYGIRAVARNVVQARIFINYRKTDGEHAGLLLHAELSERLGERSVFRDIDSIPFGTGYPHVLITNARNCRLMLSVVGRTWETACDRNGARLLDNPEDWVRREILEAIAHQVTVTPVLVGDRSRLVAEDLPEALAALAYLQFLHLPSGAGEAETKVLVDKLLRRMPDLGEPEDPP
jgi:hypothetical protein